jgi:signal transduction histidine kinase
MFTNKDIRRLFIGITAASTLFIIISQAICVMKDRLINVPLLLSSSGFAAVILGGCYLYFYRQQRMIEVAVAQVSRFLSGDKEARIDSGYEGSLYTLFHEVHTLATTLNAHALREQDAKEFLRDTISDISHQLKTPLAAVNIYNGLLQEECEDTAAVQAFAVKSVGEIERIEMLVQNLLKTDFCKSV